MQAARGEECIACRLGDTVTLTKQDGTIWFAVWDQHALCAGSKGIFPAWYRVPSVCRGPQECILLKNGELLYPPDNEIWLPLLNKGNWVDITAKFVNLPSDSRFDPVRAYVEEMKRKWGLVR